MTETPLHATYLHKAGGFQHRTIHDITVC